MIRPWRVFVWAFVAVGLSIGAWSLATPLGGGPDEPSQMVQAAAVVRGQIDGTEQPVTFGGVPIGHVGSVDVPRWATKAGAAQCFAWHPGVAASCAPGVGTDIRTVRSATQFANYPPLYYAIVGLPSLVASGSGALYGMRLMAALLEFTFDRPRALPFGPLSPTSIGAGRSDGRTDPDGALHLGRGQ